MTSSLFTAVQGLKGRGKGLPMHTHSEAQLTFVASGVVQVHTSQGRWLAPPQLAVWVPAGEAHMAEVLTDAQLQIVHCREQIVAASGCRGKERTFAVRVTPLLRALIEAAFTPDLDPTKGQLLVKLMLHELQETVDAPTFLHMPTHPAVRRLADLALDDLAQRLDLETLASRAGVSLRTASRVFRAETGLSFRTWRQRARIVQAIERLGRGRSVARVAADCGFSSTAAFSAAFRQVTALTPSQFLER